MAYNGTHTVFKILDSNCGILDIFIKSFQKKKIGNMISMGEKWKKSFEKNKQTKLDFTDAKNNFFENSTASA